MILTTRQVRVVVICDQDVLFVRSQRGVWEMPGGKIEKGESPRRAALREVGEETGIGLENLRLIRKFEKAIPHDPNVGNEFFIYVTRLAHQPEELTPTDVDEIAEARFIHHQSTRTLEPVSWITKKILEDYPTLLLLYP